MRQFLGVGRNSFDAASFVYKNGLCFEFHKILRSIYPEAVPWTNIDHVWTEIDGKFYDIDGIRLSGSEGLSKDFELFKNTHRWPKNSGINEKINKGLIGEFDDNISKNSS